MAARFVAYIALLVLVALHVEASSKILRRGKHGRLGVPPCTVAVKDLPPDQWFTQLLDHSDPTNNMTWQQRYQVVTDHYRDGGPVFINIGGEGTASAAWMVNGSWIDYAKEFGALIFQLEHRYYGKSHPTRDLSVKHLTYLSSEQALADIAYFVDGMNSLYNLTSNTKWIAFGGSYSGNLAAWVRAKYPHLIHAAMSASGPVLAKVDFFEYFDVVKNSLATYGTNCTKAVQKADKRVRSMLKKPKGQQIINNLFHLCDPIDISNQNDVYNLLESLAGNFADVVQYNKDNRFTSTRNFSLDTLCDMMTDRSISRAVKRYAAVNSFMLKNYGESCLDYKYDNMIATYKNTSWQGDGASSGGRQWTYQTCTEFGYYQTSEASDAFFNNDFPLKFFLQQCTDIYGPTFTGDVVNNGVNRSNIIYGGLDLKATRVVYVHGSIDPWHALGVTSTRIAESPAIFINGTAHCANMYPASPSDLPALTEAREEIRVLIGQWLNEDS